MDLTLSIGTVIEIGVFISGGLIAFGVMKRTIKDIEGQVESMKQQMKNLADVLTKIAVQDNRIKNLEEDVRELRHGQGWIVKPPSGISQT